MTSFYYILHNGDVIFDVILHKLKSNITLSEMVRSHWNQAMLFDNV